ncbi:pilus assembly protein N-terminal domain-containing protein [Caulobacter sp. SSI4214]|uniref:type II and III secretion system protein family protein n=1 Tax=Caulobacter sp. SSI4214 TaxID=2575739 RepID=UPI001439FEDF|nr:pilus assembly protein N-terminal domain-containing protein [Caulobacter sp. SSI4214]
MTLKAFFVASATVLWTVNAAGAERETLREGSVLTFKPASDVASVVLSNEDALAVDVRGPRQVVVFGKKEGVGELLLLDARGRDIERHAFTVVGDLSNLESVLNGALPGARIHAERASGVVVLSGEAATSAQVATAGTITAGAFPALKLVNLVRSRASDQLAVSVRVMEVRKSRLKALGIRWSAMNRFNQGTGAVGNTFASALGQPGSADLFASAKFTLNRLTLDAYINFLRTEGAATMLAEPTLVATSGQKARFLAGGEIPVPTPYINGAGVSNSLGYTFKPYGVTLEFTPEILDGERVKLELAPEVSAIDDSHVVEFGGAKVPGLVSRKTATTVTLRFGESLAIAGLRTRDTQKDRRGLPFKTPFNLGDALAGANNTQDSDTELVLIVTPETVADAQGRMPTAREADPPPVSKPASHAPGRP